MSIFLNSLVTYAPGITTMFELPHVNIVQPLQGVDGHKKNFPDLIIENIINHDHSSYTVLDLAAVCPSDGNSIDTSHVKNGSVTMPLVEGLLASEGHSLPPVGGVSTGRRGLMRASAPRAGRIIGEVTGTQDDTHGNDDTHGDDIDVTSSDEDDEDDEYAQTAHSPSDVAMTMTPGAAGQEVESQVATPAADDEVINVDDVESLNSEDEEYSDSEEDTEDENVEDDVMEDA